MTTQQTTAGTMTAIRHERYGSPTTLEYRETTTPSIAEDEVLVEVNAAGINRGDGLAIEGIPYAARLSYGLTRPKHQVPGTDLAGTVVAVGAKVAGFEPGDEVFGWGSGAFAEYAVAPAATLVARPGHIAIEEAASAPTAGVAALQALRDVGGVGEGQHVLVIGAAGGVGTFAVQIAKTLGAEVTGVCSTRDAGIVRSLGADHIVDYTQENVVERRGRYDVVIDLVGANTLTAGRRMLTEGGTYVVVGGGNPRSITGMSRFLAAYVLSPFGAGRLRPLFSTKKPEDLTQLAQLLENGAVHPVIDAVTPLRDGADSIAAVHTGHARGKVVLTP